MNHDYIPQTQEKKTQLQAVKKSTINCPKCGSIDYHKAGINPTGKQKYRCKQCQHKFVINPSASHIKILDDYWTASELGLQVSPHHNDGDKLNFSSIQQEWLKQDIKRFIRYIATTTTSFEKLQKYLSCFRNFSRFISQNKIVNRIEDITRSVIIDYLDYLNQKHLAPATKGERISAIASLFETGVTNKWFNVEPYLIRKEDYPSRPKSLPRYIPDEVIRQLNEHLDALPEPITRMVLVIQECGLRVGELCQLPLDCLKQDSKGGWFIQFMRWKMKFETTLPISIELAQAIKEQQAYIQKHFGKDYKYLFCGRKASPEFIPEPKVMTDQSFANHLKHLAEEFNICDSTGKRWNFQTHQFRHTVGTRMINNGVPQHIVQRYLGHDSPHMTMVYAHIHDATLRKEIDKYLDNKVVNINGEVIESLHPELDNDSGLQWMKKKVLAETLANGYCGLPAQLTCSKGNACLTCGDFRTTIEFLDQHKEHLERTNKVLEVAKTNGWQRQIQVNEDVKKNLENIINTLEGNKNEQ
ncbi:site-specific recombinase XerD [Nostoc sp. PCC 7524]|uniref:tyrosine-type recombinase/integrase n=1 Tax=Nostoc sp. (strain ATCC 29411 / PCC 7524) TaxID=28072 RepID=UPI00029EC664|nr:site-specific integrase [Nostoc sp. PCC 7524]AFY46045.1 site-specific recombinase XerD [Nostoc sp. PCC 7524]AFY46074.1 site-specific recombinase XerD [Nostoc sp. PCC 7524]AFY46168.1 site-specific recombinase XerD [Nostoc sp. PCC 7524]